VIDARIDVWRRWLKLEERLRRLRRRLTED
jgi:hypothetical protein